MDAARCSHTNTDNKAHILVELAHAHAHTLHNFPICHLDVIVANAARTNAQDPALVHARFTAPNLILALCPQLTFHTHIHICARGCAVLCVCVCVCVFVLRSDR